VNRAPDLPGRYAAELAARGWQGDAAQAAAVARLEQLRRELLAARAGTGPLQRLLRRLPLRALQPAPAAGPRGVYLWGGVGRGKTWLMDLFFESLGTVPRRRIHFHHLMRDVHAQLATIRDQADPLHLVAARMARRARLWCLDELHVHDIADAMLLGTLFEALLAAGCTLVFTSNVPPSGLYREGLQRARFLPAIALLERRHELLQVDGGADYRLRQLRQAPIYLPAADAATPARLEALFAQLAGAHADTARHLEVGGRPLAAKRRAGDVAWFSFATLCEGARSANDYAELAADFHTVFLEGVPVLGEQQDDAARRLVTLVDEFYDQGVKLVLSAAAQPPALYRGERLAFEFQRTTSRLIEMQSEQYLARPHQRDPATEQIPHEQIPP
jgi:cell division protein ZapE